VNAYVAVTDGVWFRFLRSLKPEEVNFWRPSGKQRFRALAPGEPFLFKLHSPHNYIVGGGFFESFSIQPASAAWARYGTGNGVSSLSEMRERIEHYRRSRAYPEDDYKIGCVILSLPFFFEDSGFLPVPEDFHPNTVQGRRYNVDSGTGRELWDSVRARRQRSQRNRT
jgi:putative restriction endonuclease